MQAYSTDLRQRVVGAVDAGVPRPEVARLFQVSVATIKRYLKQRREAGHLGPGRSPGRTPEIVPAQYPALRAQVASACAATLEDHCATWAAEQGEAVSVWALHRALKRATITRKKRP